MSQGLLFGNAVAVDHNPAVYPASRTMLSSASNEWCTHPDQLVVVRSFGQIVFDPFSNKHSLVCAERAVELPDNSLLMPWPRDGLTFANPPYGDDLPACAEKIGQEAAKGVESITLVPARTDTVWWQQFLRPVLWCAWRGRLRFLEPIETLLARHADRVEKAKRAGQKPPAPPRFKMVNDVLAEGETAPFAAAFCYHGRQLQRFAEVFGKHGKIYAEVSR